MAKLNIKESVTTADIPEVNIDSKRAAKEKLKFYMNEELRTVKGIFQNFENPGGSLPLQVKKYPGHFFNEVLKDGEEYEVPLYIARHLNGIDVTAEALNGRLGTCSYEVHKYLCDANGMPIVNRESRKRRFGFQSMEFAGSLGAA